MSSSSTSRTSTTNRRDSSTSTSADNQPFRVFFPRSYNRKYPVSNDDENSWFNNNNLPKPEELNIINQLFDNDTIIKFHSYSKDVLAQNMLIIKRLRLIKNQHNNVEYYVIDDNNRYKEQSEELFSSNSDSSADVEDSKLIKLSDEQAIQRIRQYLTTKKATKFKPSLKKNHPLYAIRKSLNESFPMLYENEYDTSNDPKKNNWYQIIHSLYEPFEFILYDRSHLLSGGVPMHQSTRIKLIFPREKNMFLLFSGYLAHNGAAALQENNVSSFNFMNSIRLFSYVDKVGPSFTTDNSTSSSSSSSRRSRFTRNSSSYVISDQASNGTVEHANTNLCNGCPSCKKIVKEKYPKKSWHTFGNKYLGEITVDLLDSYNYVNEKRKRDIKNYKRNVKKQSSSNDSENPTKKQRTSKTDDIDFDKPMLVAGGLKSFGWAVYEGVDVSQEKYYSVIDEIEKSINARGYGNVWKSIPNPGQNGERNMLKIDQKKEAFENTLNLFKDVESKVQQISEFDKSELQWNNISILRNRGNVQEQIIHRDQAKYN